MAVQFADKALDAWLTEQIQKAEKRFEASYIELNTDKNINDLIAHKTYDRRAGYLYALQDAQKQLHEFWGASILPKEETNADV